MAPDNKVKNIINNHIINGLDELSNSLSIKDLTKPKNYFSKFKIKTKKTKLPTALKTVSLNKKYRKFLGVDTGISDDIDDLSPNAYGMDSALSVGGEGAFTDGFGIDSFGITAFGESINKTKCQYLSFINSLGECDDYANGDVIESVVAGYKVLFDSMEKSTTAVICGIQPSMVSKFTFSIKKLVLAINTFSGNIISLYLGGSSELESLRDIKDWYLSIGISSEILEKMVFIEKSNAIPESSSLDYDIIPSQQGINSNNSLTQFCDDVDSAIIIGCADIYFIGELMLGYASIEKHVDIDTNFMFTI